jgi:hypothetical protein
MGRGAPEMIALDGRLPLLALSGRADRALNVRFEGGKADMTRTGRYVG